MSALAARRWACARLIGSAVDIGGGLGESKRPYRLRDERSCLPRCHPHSAMPHLRDRRACRSRLRDRCRSALPCIAGALRRSLLTSAAHAASCSVRRLPGPFPRRRRSGSHQPPDLWVDSRRVLVPFTARLFVMSAEYGHDPREASSVAGRHAFGEVVARAPHHRQRRIARVGRIGRRPFAQPEDRAALRRHDPRVPARPAQPGLRPRPPRARCVRHDRSVAV